MSSGTRVGGRYVVVPGVLLVVITTWSWAWSAAPREPESVSAQVAWMRVIRGGAGLSPTRAAPCRDGGLLVGGVSPSKAPFLIRLDEFGQAVWQRKIQGPTYQLSQVAEAEDGSVFMAGKRVFSGGTSSWVMKIDATGASLWLRDLGGLGAQTVQPTAGGGCIVTWGWPPDDPIEHPYLTPVAKLDGQGETVWQLLSSPNLGDGTAVDILGVWEEEGGECLLAGSIYIDDFHEVYEQPFVALVDSQGAVKWVRSYDTKDPYYALFLSSVLRTSDGGIVAAGSYGHVYGYTWSSFLCKFDSTGNLQWKRTLWTGAYPWCWAGTACQTIDAGYLATILSSESPPLLVKLDSEGEILWAKSFDIPDIQAGRIVSVVPREDGSADLLFEAQPSRRFVILRVSGDGEPAPTCDIDVSDHDVHTENTQLKAGYYSMVTRADDVRIRVRTPRVSVPAFTNELVCSSR